MTREFVKYVYSNRNAPRTIFEIIAIMRGFLVEGMTRLTRVFDDKEGFPKVCSAKVEIENFWKIDMNTIELQS
jgi:hypothetical protein